MADKISIIGVGKLGLCLALNLERSGFEVIGIDAHEGYVKSLNDKTFNSSEPFVNDLLETSWNVQFSTKVSDALVSDIIFVVVRTPSTAEHRYDHSDIEDIIHKLIKLGKQHTRKDLVINCTTFPGYCDSVQERLEPYNYKVSYNPEFIAQGTIINDQLFCDNILIGEADDIAGDLIEAVYMRMVESKPVVNKMTRLEAELTKLSVNCFLTTKISYANMIGDIATKLKCDSTKVLNAIGSDSRIGNKYLKSGFGFGGPCFPRDNRALARCAEDVGVDAIISKATDEMNEKHLMYQVEDFIKIHPNIDVPVEMAYVTYKRESPILEESQQLKFALRLRELGYSINIHDSRPEVVEQLKNIL